MNNKNIVELGDEVRCKVTGFSGIVTSITKWLTGCDRAGVQPKANNKENKLPDALAFDVAALEIIKKSKVKAENVQEKEKKGGPIEKVKFYKQDAK